MYSKASEQLPSSESEEEERISFLSPKEIMDEVHALEHIYNGECFMKVCGRHFLCRSR